MLKVAFACKAIAARVAYGALGDRFAAGGAATGGDRKRTLPAIAHDLFVQATEWGAVLPVWCRGTGKYRSLPDPIGRPAAICWCSMHWTGHRTSTSTCRWVVCFRSFARRGRASARGDRRLSAGRGGADLRRLCDIRPGDDARLVRRHGRSRLHARPARRVYSHPPRAIRPGRDQRVCYRHLEQPVLGCRLSGATSTNASPAASALAARISTCAGSPPWSPRRTVS